MSLGQGEIGARVKQARVEAGLTQQELAERAGLKNGANVSRIENGRTQLTPKRMRKIADATRKPLEFFVRDLAAANGAAATEERADLQAVTEQLASLARAVAEVAAAQAETAVEVREIHGWLREPPQPVEEQNGR